MEKLHKPTSGPIRGSRVSADALNGPSSGYNQMSFLHPGREEPLKGGRDEDEEAGQRTWDIYADFNNAGPRYSSAFVQNTDGYQKINHPSPKREETPVTTGPVEMVTVPALGPEWGLSEMRDMTKAGKREKKTEVRKTKWKQWVRDERGIYGTCLTRRVLVWSLFAVCIAIGIVLAFTIPRVPAFSFNVRTPLANATGSFRASVPIQFSRFPANFTFPAYANLQLDTSSNYLPLTFNHLRGQVFDIDTGRQVASGDLGKKTVPAKAFPQVFLPLNFTYVATNDSDPTWMNWYASCKNHLLYPDGARPGLKFRLVLEADIRGLIGSRASSTQISGASCPIELPMNSV